MQQKHLLYLESSLSTIPPRKQGRQLDRSLLEEKENMRMVNAEKNLSGKSHWQDSSSGQLDYLRMIREKEETIKELTSMLEMMNESVGDDHKIQKLTSAIQDYKHQIEQYEQEMRALEQQVKILTIENECLISVIQKNEINLPSQRENILQRQIAELKESLQSAEKQLEETRHNSRNASQKLLKAQNSAKGLSRQNVALSDHNRELQTQCQKLVRLLKEKEECETKRISHLVCKGGERITLSKIREQYCENISLTKQYFISEAQKMFESYQKVTKQAEFKLDYLAGKVEQMKKAKEIKSQCKPQEKQASLEIQYLMQKYYQTEKHLEQQKQANTRLNSELETAQKTLRELSLRSMDGSGLFDISSSLRKGELSQELAKLNEEMSRLKDCQRENSSLKQAMRELQSRMQHETATSNLKMQTVMSCYQNQLKDKISVLNNQLFLKNQQIDVLSQNSQQLTTQLKEARFQLQTSRNLNTQRSEQISVLHNKIKEIEAESQLQFARLKALASDSEIKVERLSQSYNCRLEFLQNEVNKKQQALSSLREELTSNKDELFKQRNILSDYTERPLQVELESLRTAVREIRQHSFKEDRNESLPGSFDSSLQMKIEDGLKMAQQLSQLRSDISQKQRHSISLQTHIDSLSTQIQNLRFQVKQKSLQASHLQRQKYLIELAHAKPTSLNFEMFIGIVDKLLSLEMKNKEKNDGKSELEGSL